MAEFLPIKPNLTAEGAFAALAQLPNGAAMKPVALDAGEDAFGGWYDKGSQLDFGVAAQLGLTGIANASGSFQSKTITYDAALYADSGIKNPPNGGIIYATRWGAGLRVHIYVMDFGAKFGINLGNVAAAASVGLVSASYRIEAFGITDPGVLADMPGPGRFDETTYKQIRHFVDAILHKNLIPRTKLSAVPFMIAVDRPGVTFAGPIDRARTALFAMRRIAKGMSQRDAVGRARMAALDPIFVEKIYQEWALTSEQHPVPSTAAQGRAKAWLDKINLG